METHCLTEGDKRNIIVFVEILWTLVISVIVNMFCLHVFVLNDIFLVEGILSD
jgi:hypothetical protein